MQNSCLSYPNKNGYKQCSQGAPRRLDTKAQCNLAKAPQTLQSRYFIKVQCTPQITFLFVSNYFLWMSIVSLDEGRSKFKNKPIMSISETNLRARVMLDLCIKQRSRANFSTFINAYILQVYKYKRYIGIGGNPTLHKVWASNLQVLTVGVS